MNLETFETFSNGNLCLPEFNTAFKDIPWTKHPKFEGVEQKNIITAKDTNGKFSYHLVKIAPGKTIFDHIHEMQLETHEVIAGEGVCINDGKEIHYAPGVISIMPEKIHHEVHAGQNGLYMFAKFIPAQC